jgi:hypothetical protein
MFCYVQNWRCDQIKSEWGGWGMQETGEKKNAHKILDGKREKKHLEDLWVDGWDNAIRILN